MRSSKIGTVKGQQTHNYQLSTLFCCFEPKNKNKLSKQLEQEQIYRNGDLMKGYQWGGGGGRMGKKVQGIRSINGRYKIHRGRLRIVWEMEKPKNLYVQPMGMN